MVSAPLPRGARMPRASAVTQRAVTYAVDALRISGRASGGLTARGAATAPPHLRRGWMGTTRAPGGAPSTRESRSVAAMNPPAAAVVDERGGGWVSLGTPRSELVLAHTLPTGQSFRWRLTTRGDYVGVIGKRVVSMRQCDDDVLYRVHCRPAGEDATHDAAAVADYFNLSVSLGALAKGWAKADARFAKLQPHLPGCRMLRQDPAECLFSFICSSNNHISRIHGMVERLCAAYGTKLVVDAALSEARKATANPTGTPKKKKKKKQKKKRKLANDDETKAEDDDDDDDDADRDVDEGEPLGDFYSFPTVSQLAFATEADLRAAGFGYRAKFIAGAVAALSKKPNGADAYLSSLRHERSYKEAQAALGELPGVGPKVAACACLFSLDKHEAIPVDTHVWRLATEHYCAELEGKSLTPKVMDAVEEAVIKVFGSHAGWAHNTLFIAELAHVRAALPEELRTPPRAKAEKKTPKKESNETPKKKESKKASAGGAGEAGEELDGLLASPSPERGSFRAPKKSKAAIAADDAESEYL